MVSTNQQFHFKNTNAGRFVESLLEQMLCSETIEGEDRLRVAAVTGFNVAFKDGNIRLASSIARENKLDKEVLVQTLESFFMEDSNNILDKKTYNELLKAFGCSAEEVTESLKQKVLKKFEDGNVEEATWILETGRLVLNPVTLELVVKYMPEIARLPRTEDQARFYFSIGQKYSEEQINTLNYRVIEIVRDLLFNSSVEDIEALETIKENLFGDDPSIAWDSNPNWSTIDTITIAKNTLKRELVKMLEQDKESKSFEEIIDRHKRVLAFQRLIDFYGGIEFEMDSVIAEALDPVLKGKACEYTDNPNAIIGACHYLSLNGVDLPCLGSKVSELLLNEAKKKDPESFRSFILTITGDYDINQFISTQMANRTRAERAEVNSAVTAALNDENAVREFIRKTA